MSLVVICPSKGRSGQAKEAYKTFLDTRKIVDTEIVFAVNDNEDHLYAGLPMIVVPKMRWMNEVLGAAVRHVMQAWNPTHLGFIGDDNRFVTIGWDSHVVDAIDKMGGGYAHCNDLHRSDIPTHVFVSAKIVDALGYFGLPGLRHMYMDNVWATLGNGSGHMKYLPMTTISHLHFTNGKNKFDDTYQLSNNPETMSHDQQVFEDWLATRSADDIEIVRSTFD